MSDLIKEISIDLIDDPAVAMRSDVHDEDIDSLAASIKEHGLLEPLVVRPNGSRYELIAGHRRLTACKIISKIMIPCTIREVTEEQALILRIQENTHRLDVNPVDDALYFHSLIERLKITPQELAASIKRKVSYVEDRLSVLDMPDLLILAVGNKDIGIRAAQSLMKITDEAYRDSLVEIAVKDGISADTAERWAYSWKLGILPSAPTSESMSAVIGEDAPPETYLTCMKCRGPGVVRDMLTVWIHRECPSD